MVRNGNWCHLAIRRLRGLTMSLSVLGYKKKIDKLHLEVLTTQTVTA